MRARQHLPALAGAALLTTLTAWAQPWQAPLKGGGQLQVDPSTRRATITGPGGTASQAWDGVHRLENGTTVTVESGVAVPRTDMLPSLPPASGTGFVVEGPSPCVHLVRKTCGIHDECRDAEACSHANRLLEYEMEEERETRGSSLGLATTRQCKEALADEEFFKACPTHARGSRLTPCEELVDRVCGADGRCAASPACPPVQVLLESEYRERAAALDPDGATASTAQCRQALQDPQFFRPCPQ